MALFKSFTTPGSNSMVVTVPVEPRQKTVTLPSVSPERASAAATSSVMSMMSENPWVSSFIVPVCTMEIL